MQDTSEQSLLLVKQFEERNTLFIEQYQNKPVLYLGMVENKEEQQIVKYGYTQNTKATLKRHQESYGTDFHYIYALECKEHYNLENQIQNHNDLSTRHIKKYNEKDRQELLRLDKNFSIKDLITLVVKMKNDIENDRNLRLKEIEIEEVQERTKQIEAQERTKQIEAQEKTKQLELELEILKLKRNNQQESSSSTSQRNINDDKKELVKKFLQLETIMTTKSKDYIFLDEVFCKLEDWLHTNGYIIHIPRQLFGNILGSLEDVIIKRISIGPRIENVTPRKTAIIYRTFR